MPMTAEQRVKHREWVKLRKMEVYTRRKVVEELLGDLHATAPAKPRRVKTMQMRIDEEGMIELHADSQLELGLDDQRMLTVAEAADKLRWTAEHVRRRLRSGSLRGARRPGGPWLITERELFRFMRR